MKYHQFTPDPETVAARIVHETAALSPVAPKPHAPPPPAARAAAPAEPPSTLEGLTALRDGAFIEAAYRHLLGRDPDPDGYARFLSALRSGAADKIDVLGDLRYSEEGRQRGAPLAGLRKRYTLRRLGRLRVIGSLYRWVVALLRLPMLVNAVQRHQAEMEQAQIVAESHASAIQQFQPTENAVRELRAQMRVLRDFAPRLGKAEGGLSELRRLAETLSARVAAAEATFEARHQRLSDANARLLQQLRALNASIAALQPLMPRDRDASPPPAPAHGAAAAGFDTFYVDFEDRFRGSPEATKRSHELYLDYVTRAGAGTEAAPVLDVGCGRGEWLDLLREHGCIARGVDMNRAMVMENTQRGLDVVERDVLTYLADLPEASVGMVTGFHIIEHLPFEVLVRLFDECRRVLRPGGCVLFETPNPENLVVGAYTFYFDPTHRNPLPPALVEFLAQHRGFADVEVVRLHPRPEGGMDQALLDRWFRTATDYAVVGWKDGRPAR